MSTASVSDLGGDHVRTVLGALRGVVKRGKGWSALCPAHDDREPSLDIDVGRDGRVLLICRAGCDQGAVISAAGLDAQDLFPPRPRQSREIEATYDYVGADGVLRYQVVRRVGKQFVQRRPNPDAPGEWIWNMKGVQRVPYRLPQLLEAIEQSRRVFIVEGEKDADRLVSLGLVATTHAGGAGKWSHELAAWFRGAHVHILPDNDTPGMVHVYGTKADPSGKSKRALGVAPSLRELAASIRIIHLEDLPEKGDVSDWLDSGGTLRGLVDQVLATPIWDGSIPVSEDAPPPDETQAEATDGEEGASRFRLTDIGNGERLIARHGQDLHFVSRWNKWIVWDGQRWALDETREVERRAKEAVRSMYAEADAIKGTSDRLLARKAALVKHAVKSESNRAISSMIARAVAEPGVAIDHERLDAEALLLPAGNGTIDLASGELLAFERMHLATRRTEVKYDPDAKCPRWLAFLDRVLADNHALIDFIQRAVGYSLTGITSEQVLFFLWGSGANGKSTFLEVLRLLGGGYATQADFSTFLERKGDGPRNDVARLVGTRIVTSSEVGEGKRLDEGLIKSLTGGDRIAARFLYAETFEFTPRFHLWWAANHKPIIRGTDTAIWRRIRLVPFTVQIPEEERDPILMDALKAELPGILTWAVQGAVAWLERGLGVPEEVQAATDQYRSESDVIGAFLEDRCELANGFSVPATDLYRAYREWAEATGEYVLSQIRFSRALEERGGLSRQRPGGRADRTVQWFGVRLLSDDEESGSSSYYEREGVEV